jgi:hypothetical protein
MQVEFIVNGGISLIFSPDNPMEEELVKALMKQQNEIMEFRTAQTILNKTFRNGIVIGKKTSLSPDKKTEATTEVTPSPDDKKD